VVKEKVTAKSRKIKKTETEKMHIKKKD